MNTRYRWGLGFYFLTLVILAAWSYAFTDPNLIMLNQPWFVVWQNYWWQIAQNAGLLGGLFISLTTVMVIGYLNLWRALSVKSIRLKKFIPWLTAIAVILSLGYNAYSHDIFNYLFNAKMIWQYGANPHVQVALDFVGDPWLRFMHNVHTPAPYGYGWTVLSLVPYAFSFGKFLTAYLAMKGWMIVGWVWLLGAVWQLIRSDKLDHPAQRWLGLAFHPLVLIETLLNGHNDVWMMAPALTAWYLLSHRRRSATTIGLVIGLMVFSISIKFVTILLLPLMLLTWWPLKLRPQLDWIRDHWAEIATLLLILPLLTSRSQQFHPWYLIWALSFLPLTRWRWLEWGVSGLSLSALYRYYPWILNDFQYTDQVELQMRLITWSGLLLGLGGWLMVRWQYNRKHH